MAIRPYRDEDLAQLHAINQASTPGVSSETERDLGRWIDLSTCLIAADEADRAQGFITLMPLGLADYASPNMRWFEAYGARTGEQVIYVDRIALAPNARGFRLGEALYHAAFNAFRSHDAIGCEVNTLPPNPGSHRFHQRLGFKQVGEQVFVPDEKAVSYYVKTLTS